MLQSCSRRHLDKLESFENIVTEEEIAPAGTIYFFLCHNVFKSRGESEKDLSVYK